MRCSVASGLAYVGGVTVRMGGLVVGGNGKCIDRPAILWNSFLLETWQSDFDRILGGFAEWSVSTSHTHQRIRPPSLSTPRRFLFLYDVFKKSI